MEMKYLTMIVLFFGVMLQEGMSQTRDSSSCMSKLLPCMNYLNEAKGDPPQSCCNPLKEVIRKMPECLCQMVSIKGSKAAEQAGIDVNEAQMLPAKCGQPVNYMGCLKGIDFTRIKTCFNRKYTNKIIYLLIWNLCSWF